MYREERATGVTVQVLDMSALELQALNYRKISRPECYEARIFGGEVAIHKSENGHLYSICTEGVGQIVSAEEPVEFQFHGSYHVRMEDTIDENGNIVPGEIDPHRHTFDALPFASIELDDEELKEYPVKREEDLSTFIRTFGARLEQNFWLWFNTLSK